MYIKKGYGTMKNVNIQNVHVDLKRTVQKEINKSAEVLPATQSCKTIQENGSIKMVPPYGLLQNDSLPDTAFSSSSGKLFIPEP